MKDENMKYWWKIQMYETQVILYWILGVLILHLGGREWVGWLAIGYGWFTLAYTLIFAVKNARKLKDLF